MDGVLTDFVSAALDIHGAPHHLQQWPAGVFDMAQVLGISSSRFWAGIDRAGEEFWTGLEEYGWSADLLELVESYGEWSILSSPSMNPDSISGKLHWLQARFGKSFRRFLIGPCKHLCAGPDAVLIDDHDGNVDRFIEHGGQAILFPQPWNRNHAISDPVAFVHEQLDQIQPNSPG